MKKMKTRTQFKRNGVEENSPSSRCCRRRAEGCLIRVWMCVMDMCA